MNDTLTYAMGFPEALRPEAAELYDQAFGEKLALAIPSRGERLALLTECLVPGFAISAARNGVLVGLAGYHTADGSLTGGLTARRLLARLGVFRGCRAACVLSLYERHPEPGELVMDGIAVRGDMRGRGIGGQLLDQLASYARDHGFGRIRLDVIDTNSAARRLYQRKGFVAVHTERIPYLRWLFGFGAATRMERRVASAA